MPFVARKGDSSSGHDLCPGVPIVGNVSSDVKVNGKPCATDGSVFAAHGCLVHPAHSGVVVAPDRKVLVNGKNIACVGDAESCGGTIVAGSDDVKVG